MTEEHRAQLPENEPAKAEAPIGEEPVAATGEAGAHPVQPEEVADEPMLTGPDHEGTGSGPSTEREAEWEYTPPKAGPVPSREERSAAAIAHGGIILNLFSGIGGLLVALVVWLAYKDKSEYVRYQALQALVFQGLLLVGATLLGVLAVLIIVVGGISAVFLVGIPILIGGIIAVVVAAVAPIAGVIYGIVAAVETNDGRPFRYWLVADMLQ